MDDIKKICCSINPKSARGRIGITNEFLLWIFERETQYKLLYAIRKLSKIVIEEQIPDQIRKLLLYSKA
jgi:hypothetical protein